MDPRDEILRQLRYENDKGTAATRGMTLRELVLELRQDLKELGEDLQAHVEKGHPTTPTRAEMYGALFVFAGLIVSAIRLFQ